MAGRPKRSSRRRRCPSIWGGSIWRWPIQPRPQLAAAHIESFEALSGHGEFELALGQLDAGVAHGPAFGGRPVQGGEAQNRLGVQPLLGAGLFQLQLGSVAGQLGARHFGQPQCLLLAQAFLHLAAAGAGNFQVFVYLEELALPLPVLQGCQQGPGLHLLALAHD